MCILLYYWANKMMTMMMPYNTDLKEISLKKSRLVNYRLKYLCQRLFRSAVIVDLSPRSVTPPLLSTSVARSAWFHVVGHA